MSMIVRLLWAVLLSRSGMVAAAESYVLPPHATVAGKALGDHGAAWWQWSFSMPLDDSPVRDLTGEKCAKGQQGEVWFLAGTYGSDQVKRSCTIPAGRYIFFPIINMAFWPQPNEPISCADVQEGAAMNNDNMAFAEIEIDGVRVASPWSHREISSKCFDIFARVPKDVGPPPGFPAASDGFWIMLKPLPPGTHTIKYRARYNRPGGAYGTMSQNVFYDITVAKP